MVGRLATLVLIAVLSGCAARGTILRDAPALAPLTSDQARLFIYRDVVRGGIQVDMVRPDMLVNGTQIGEMQAGAVIVITVPAGSYLVELAPPPGGPAWAGYRPLGEGQRVELAAGSEAYVKIVVAHLRAAGSDFAVRIAPPDLARKEIQERVLQERKLPSAL